MIAGDPALTTSPIPAPRCSVVIRAYNEAKHIGRLLEGLRHQSIQDIQIILVDSGSSDATVDIAASYNADVVHIRPEEFSFGRSLNLGVAQARAEYVVIASAHVYPVYPDWLEHLLAPFAHPQVALSYGKQRGTPGSYFSEQQVFAHWYPDHSNPLQDVPFCNNANAAIRRSLWEQYPYDESLSGLEDLDWAHHMVEAGHRLAYVAEAEIIHVHHETPRGVFNRYRREAMAFKRIFPHEHFRRRDLVRLVTSNILSDLWHAARQRRLSRSFGSIFWFRWMQFWGTFQGYRQAGPLTWQLRQTFYYPRSLDTASPAKPRDVEPIRYQD